MADLPSALNDKLASFLDFDPPTDEELSSAAEPEEGGGEGEPVAAAAEEEVPVEEPELEEEEVQAAEDEESEPAPEDPFEARFQKMEEYLEKIREAQEKALTEVNYRVRKIQESSIPKPRSRVADLGPEPNRELDPEGWGQYQADVQSIQAEEQAEAQQATEAQIGQILQETKAQEDRFVAANPDYYEVVGKVRDNRIRSYIQMGWDPQSAQRQVFEEIAGFIGEVRNAGGDPVAESYRYAKQTYDSQGLGGQPQQAEAQKSPTHEDVERVKRGSARPPSLSQAAGSGKSKNGWVTWDYFQANVPYDKRLEIFQKHPGFRDAMMQNDKARLPAGVSI